MTHREKVRHLINSAPHLGLGRWTVAPPFWRMLWWFGFTLPPPHFMPRGQLFVLFVLTAGPPFGLAMGGMAWLALANTPWAAGVGLATGVGFGLTFSAVMVRTVRSQARQHGFPPWDQYPHFAHPVEPYAPRSTDDPSGESTSAPRT